MSQRRSNYRAGLLIAAVVVLLTAFGVDQLGHRSQANPGGAAQTMGNGRVVQSSSPAPRPSARAFTTASPQWALTWEDNFSSPAGLSKWEYVNGNLGGPALQQLQWYDSNNAQVDGQGHLVITAAASGGSHQCWNGPCKYTSVRMDTMGLFSQKYGVFEARIKVPNERGIWPAFWMEGANYNSVGLPTAGEIDIIEINGRDGINRAEGFAHAPHLLFRGHSNLPQPLSAGYHVYGVKWTRTGITWMVDGQAYAHMDSYHKAALNHPFIMLLNLAVGGGWPGPPSKSTHFPVHMYVDWVRVYRHV